MAVKRSKGAPTAAKPARPRATFDILFPALYALLYGAIVLAVHARCGLVGDFDIESDFYGDLVLAAKRLDGGSFSVLDYPYKGPLYSVALVALHVAVGDWYRTAVILNMLCAAGALFVTYRLAALVFGRRVAIPTVVFTSLVVDFFVHAHRATTDLLFLLLATSSILVFVRSPTWKARAAAGGLAGMAFLTRYNGGFLLLGGLLALAFLHATPWKGRLRQAATYLAGFLLVCLPWFSACMRETGSLLPAKNVQNVVMGLSAGPRWANLSIDDMSDLGRAVAQDSRHVVAQVARNWLDHFGRDLGQLIGWPGALLALLGILGLILVPPARAVWSYLCFPVVYFLCMGVLFYSPRFFFLLVPAYYGLGLAFLLHGTERPPSRLGAWLGARIPTSVAAWARKISARRGSRVALLLLAAGLVIVQVWRIHVLEPKLDARRPLYLLKAAPVLARHAAAHGRRVMMARKGHLAYLAGLEYEPYPRAAARSLDKLLTFAQERNVDYIVYGNMEFELCPDLRFLATQDSIQGLRTIYASRTMRVFERTGGSFGALDAAERVKLLRQNLRLAEERNELEVVVQALDDLADVHAEQGQVQEAAAYLRRVIDVAENATTARPTMLHNAAVGRHRLARLYLQSGNAPEAIPLLEENLNFFTRRGNATFLARTHVVLGGCYAALGRDAEATTQFQQAHALDPSVPAP